MNQIQRENTEFYNTLTCYKDCNKIIIYNSDSIHFFLFWSLSNISCFSEAALFMALAFEIVALMSTKDVFFPAVKEKLPAPALKVVSATFVLVCLV